MDSLMIPAAALDYFVHPVGFVLFALWWIATLFCVSICQRHINIPVEHRQWYNLLVLICGPWALAVLLSRYRYPSYQAAAREYQEKVHGGPVIRFIRRILGIRPQQDLEEPGLELCTADGKPLSKMNTRYSNRDDESEALIRVKNILKDSVDMRATDILLDPRSEDVYAVRFRIDGELEELEQTSNTIGLNMVNCLKIASRMDIAERRRPQDGSFMIRLHEADINCRLATAGTLRGPKAAVRLLDRRVGLKPVTELGMSGHDLTLLLGAVNRKSGMILVCGPTGSGKTTSLYAVLNQFDPQSRNLVTVEDPIEYPIEHATQTEVNERAGITFASVLRSMLRQNPDVILVGEIRDQETAELALQASNTGHLVLSTVHGNNSSAATLRLRDLGIPPHRLSGAVSVVLSQRLVRKLCDHCKKPTELRGEQREFGMNHGLPSGKAYEAVGCEQCRNTGFFGREGIFELLFVNRDVNEVLAQDPSIVELRDAAIRAGMVPMAVHGVEKVKAGVTTMDEVMRVCEEED